MKIQFILGFLLLSPIRHGACAEGGAILSNLLVKARSVKTYHLRMRETAIMDPVDSGHMFRMETSAKGDLWVKRVKGTTWVCKVGNLILKPIGHPELMNSVSNVVVYDGKEYYDVQYQGQLASGVRYNDPGNTCKVFGEADTVIRELMNDSGVRYLGRKTLDSVSCQVFQTSAKYFSPQTTAGHVDAEVAIDDNLGLPVRISFKMENSSSQLDFEKAEVDAKISESHFKAPTGVKFQDAESDGHGGWQMRLER